MQIFSSGRLLKFLDPGLALVLLLTLFNIVPLASNPGLPNGTDVLYHSYRVSEMWQHGLLAPSWAEDFYPGYGSPLFHCCASLTYYLTSVFHFLLGLGALDALRLLLLGSLLTCGGGMYLFSRRRSGCLGAVIAGLLYAYSPHLMYTEAYARGAYPELLTFALFPLLLWRVDALRDKTSPTNFVAVFLLQVALINAHNLMALILTGLAIAWVAFETAIQHFNREASQMRPRSGLLALLAMLLGALGSATLWLPALLESDSAHLENLTVSGRLGYGRNFVRLEQLLSPAPIHDAGAINGLRELRVLGLAQWIAALAGAFGAAALYIRGYRTRHPQGFLGAACFAVLALALIFLTTPASRGIWEAIRPLQLLQFPWRLLGPLAACLAIVGSMNGMWLERLERRYQIGMVALAIALPIVSAVPLLYVPEWRYTQLDTSTGAFHEEELAARQLGATVTVESRPRAAHATPAPKLASVASALSIVVLLLMLWFLRNRQQTVQPYWSSPPLSRTSLIGILLGGGIALLTFALTFREGSAWLNSPPGEALPAQYRTGFTLDDNLQLLGYDLSSERLRAGDTLTVKAYWYALKETDINFSSFLQLSSDGTQVARIDKPHPGERPVREWWRPAGYIIDSYDLWLPRDLPAGEYELIIGLYACELRPTDDCDNLYRPEVRDGNGDLIGDRIPLASIRVDAP